MPDNPTERQHPRGRQTKLPSKVPHLLRLPGASGTFVNSPCMAHVSRYGRYKRVVILVRLRAFPDIDGLNRGMAKISEARDAMRDVVETWESERALLQHAFDFAETTFGKEWDDPALKERAVRTAKVAEEVLSWTPESMVKSILKEKHGKHPEKG